MLEAAKLKFFLESCRSVSTLEKTWAHFQKISFSGKRLSNPLFQS